MSDERAQSNDLIRRAPGGYLWNQAFSLWLFLSLFLYQLVITNALPLNEKGIYEKVLSPATFAMLLAALGLESAGSVYVPRALAAGGPAAAIAVALRLIWLRVMAVALVAVAILWGLPALASLLALTGVPAAVDLEHTLSSPVLQAHRLAIAGYVLGMGLSSLMASLLTALLRTGVVFVVGGLAQLSMVVLAYVFVGPLHGGADAALTAQSVPGVVMAVIYGFAIWRVLRARPAWRNEWTSMSILKLGTAAWLADLANGSLVKLIAIAQLAFIVSNAQIAFFGLAYEMGHAAAFLFVAGLGGVGLAVMSAAYATQQRAHLATAWRTVSKLQVLLAVPLVAFCIPHADAIMRTLYGARYADAGVLLALFLGFNALVRLGGGGSHEAALYVLGRQRWVVIARWVSLALLAGGDVLLIPRFGAAGALTAVGVSQLSVELFLLVLAQHTLKRPYPAIFNARVLAAMVPALLFASVWRPQALVLLFFSGLGYAAIFLVALRLVRPLDSEDRLLLAEVAAPLRKILLPFVAPTAKPYATPTPVAPITRMRPALEPVASQPLPQVHPTNRD